MATEPTRLAQLDIDLLLALDALLREHSVTRAAHRLRITQPALSARLVRLRGVFADRLFVPAASGRGVVPTPRALALQPLLESALETLERLTDPAAGFDPVASTRTFVTALHDNPAVMLVPELVSSVTAEAPGVRLAFQMPDPTRIAADLESGRVDVVIAAPATADPSWIGRTLCDERFLTAQRKGHPRGTEELDLDTFCALDHLLISSDGGGFTGLVDDALSILGRERRVIASIQNYALAPLIVEAGDSVCTLPRRFLARFADTLDVFAPPLELGRFEFAVYWHARNQEEPGHVWFREQVARAARAAAPRPVA